LKARVLKTINDTQIVSKIADGISGDTCLGTHNGSFHCDEALATAMLKVLPQFKGHAIVRSRHPDTLAACAVCVDVGGVYDPATNRFDHHQKTFSTVLGEDYKIKLSSAGLVYKHFGRKVIEELTEHELSVEVIDMLYDKVYKGFVEHVDAIDNGVEIAEGELQYSVTTSLSSRVGQLNPPWNIPGGQNDELANARFKEAMKLTIDEFSGNVFRLAYSWWPARSLVQNAMSEEARKAVHPSGEVMLLDTFCPWQAHLFAIEEQLKIEGLIKYCLFQDSHGAWRIQAVSAKAGSFANRLPLPEKWRGVRDAALSELSGIDGCIFVHAGGFIGGNATKEGVLQMASQALELGTPPK
jgi:uncharacterized UPF0160 family protein